MLSFNAKNIFSRDPVVYIPVEEDPLPIDFDLSLSFAPFTNSFDFANTEYIAIDNLANRVAHEFPLKLPSDHHDYRSKLYPETYDYMANDVMPDGVKINQKAHDEVSLQNEIDVEIDSLHAVALNRYNTLLKILDTYAHDPIGISEAKREYQKDLVAIGDLPKTRIYRFRDIPMILLKTIVSSAGELTTGVPSFRLVMSLIERTMSQFFQSVIQGNSDDGRTFGGEEGYIPNPNAEVSESMKQALISLMKGAFVKVLSTATTA